MTMLKYLMDEDPENGAGRAYVTLDNTAILQTAKEGPALFLKRYRPLFLSTRSRRPLSSCLISRSW